MKPVFPSSFEIPVVLRGSGDYIEMKSKRGKNVIRGTLTQNLRSNDTSFHVKLNGTSTPNLFRREDWFVTLLQPEVEDGIYVGIGNVYRVVNNEITGVDAGLTLPRERSTYTRETFVEYVKAGRIRRVADSHGTWAP